MKKEYYVAKDGVPCRLDRPDICRKRILVKCSEGEEPTIFGLGYKQSIRRCLAAIKRTYEKADVFKGSLLAGWDSVRCITDSGVFTVEKRNPPSLPVKDL